MTSESDLLEHLSRHQDEIISDLRQLVEHESPSKDKSRLDECARFLADRCSTLIGGSVETHPARTNGNHLLVRKSGSQVGSAGPATSAL